MKKPADLRQVLTEAVPYLKDHPDRLHVFVDEGRIVATGGATLSFEYQYTLNLVITDYNLHADTVMVPILGWLRRNQSELLFNPDRRRDGFKFEVDILNHKTCDISIDLTLTERVIVKEVDGALQVTHADEPPLDQYEDVTSWEVTWPDGLDG